MPACSSLGQKHVLPFSGTYHWEQLLPHCMQKGIGVTVNELHDQIPGERVSMCTATFVSTSPPQEAV